LSGVEAVVVREGLVSWDGDVLVQDRERVDSLLVR
jgi:hypothetical protein